MRSILACAAFVCALPGAAHAVRVTNGLVAHYPLTEGQGATASDHAAPLEPIDLEVRGRAVWLPGGNGVAFDGGRVGHPNVGASSTPLALISSLQATGASTFEVWIDPANLSQSGPARILSLGARFMLGQNANDLEVRLLHTGKNSNAKPWLTTIDDVLDGGLCHVVHTFDGTTERLYVNGVLDPTTVVVSGGYANWPDSGRFVFGQEASVSPENQLNAAPWEGDLRMVAVYDRALTPSEVAANFAAGADLPVVHAGSDRASQGLPGQPTLVVPLDGSVPGAPSVASTWSVASTPPGGGVSFDDAGSPATNATFTNSGSYVLRLSADDAGVVASDDVNVDVDVFSAAIPLAQNLAPEPGAIGVSVNPVLDLVCEPGSSAARHVIATDAGFTAVVYDSGVVAEPCSHVSDAALSGATPYFWSARVRDADGLWSDWSTPTSFVTGDTALHATVSLRDGENGYAGTADTDLRGHSEDPFNPTEVWNQGAQGEIRSGRRPNSTLENYRSLLRFDLSGVAAEPGAVLSAHLELTGDDPGSADFDWEGVHVFHRMLRSWGEGAGLTDPPAPGEASWLHDAEPTLWGFPGAGGGGVDHEAAVLIRRAIPNVAGGVTRLSSAAFVDAVRAWMADPSSNHGLLLQAENELLPGVLRIGSRNHASTARRPRLVLELQQPALVAIAAPAPDFAPGFDTPLTAEVRFGNGALVTADSATQLTFTPTSNGRISGVVTGTGDGSYGVVGGAETVTVSGGVATILLENDQTETFDVAITDGGTLVDPPNDAIDVFATASHVAVAAAAADFTAGGSTTLQVEVRNPSGVLIDDDATTQVNFTPSGSARVSGVLTGTGDGGYGVPAATETVTVSGGIATIALEDPVAESFAVAITNGAGLLNPPAEGVTSLPGPPVLVALTLPAADFTAGGSTALGVTVQDALGNTAPAAVVQVTFTPTGSARIASVTTGTGDGSYGAPGGSETVAVAAGVATVVIEDEVAEGFSVAFANDASLADPPADTVVATPGAAASVLLATPGEDFFAGGGTSLSLRIVDAFGNPIADDVTQLTVDPEGDAFIAGVSTGTGDGAYGVIGAAETVTASGGVVTVVVGDTLAETFGVSFTNDGGLTDPADDEIVVSAGPAAQIGIVDPGGDFTAGESIEVAVAVQDAFGNAVADDTPHVTFTPSGNARITDVLVGVGDGSYGGLATPELVGISGGLARVVLEDTVAESFLVAFANDAGLADPLPLAIAVDPGPGVELVVTSAPTDFVAGGGTSLSVAALDAFGNVATGDDATEVTFTPSGSGAIGGVITGTASGGYTNMVLYENEFLGDPTATSWGTATMGNSSPCTLGNAGDEFTGDGNKSSGGTTSGTDQLGRAWNFDECNKGVVSQANLDFLTARGAQLEAWAAEIRAAAGAPPGGPTVGFPLGHHVFDFVHAAGAGTTTSSGWDPPFSLQPAEISEKAALVAGVVTYPVGLPGSLEPDDLGDTHCPADGTISKASDVAGLPVISLSGVTGPVYLVADCNRIGTFLAVRGGFKVAVWGSAYRGLTTVGANGTDTEVWVVDSLLDAQRAIEGGEEDGAAVFGSDRPMHIQYSEVLGGVDSAKLYPRSDLFKSHFHGYTRDSTNPAGDHNDGIQCTAGAEYTAINITVDGPFRASNAPMFCGQAGDKIDHRVAWSLLSGGTNVYKLGSKPGSFGTPGESETIGLENGVAAIAIESDVAEAFVISFANDGGMTNPVDEAILVSPGPAAQVGFADPGDDFTAGGSTQLSVALQDVLGNTVSDDVVVVTLTPTGSAAITAVSTGTGDGSYGVAGGSEDITLAGGLATVTLENTVAGTFFVAIDDDSGYPDAADDEINVLAAASAQLVLTTPGSDFATGGGTSLAVEVHDAFGNRALTDDTTLVTFSPSGAAMITDALTGSGDGLYATPGGSESVQVAGGVASIALGNQIAETFDVSFGNDAGLPNPAPDSITVGAGADQLVITIVPTDFTAGGSTTLRLEARDPFGNPISDGTTTVMLDPTGSARIASVALGAGDGSYGAPGVAEMLQLSGGVLEVDLEDSVAETFSVSIANSGSYGNPPPPVVASLIGPPAVLALVVPGADFPVGAATVVRVRVEDAAGNPIAGDDATQVTFTPSGSARVGVVSGGSGDGSYGVPGGAETVTVAGGVAEITFTDDAVETFTIAFANTGGVSNPPDQPITVYALADVPALGVAARMLLVMWVGVGALWWERMRRRS